MLRSEEIGAAREAWPALIFGLASILLLTPFFARVILQVHLNPHEFVTGLGIFCCMPTTLSSGVALTQLVGGNSALALAMTVISNFLGTLTVPLSLAKFIGVGFSVPTMQLCKSLIMTLLVPLALGKVLRDCVTMVAIYVDQNRKFLSVISAILLSLVPAAQVSRSKALLFTVRPEVFATAVGMGAKLCLSWSQWWSSSGELWASPHFSSFRVSLLTLTRSFSTLFSSTGGRRTFCLRPPEKCMAMPSRNNSMGIFLETEIRVKNL